MEFTKTFTKDYKRFRYYIDGNSVSSDKFYDWKYIMQLRCKLNKAEFYKKEIGNKSVSRVFETVIYKNK